MIQLSRILCAIDFSTPARTAFVRALALNREHNAELTVVQAVPVAASFNFGGRVRMTPIATLRIAEGERPLMTSSRAPALDSDLLDGVELCVTADQDRRSRIMVTAVRDATPTTKTIRDVLLRVQGEYRDMPGLKLTEAQAQRLLGIDCDTCTLVLSTLIERRFLRRTANGLYVRA